MSQIGLIGLAVMGENLARNIASKGFSINVYNRTTEKTDAFIKEHGSDKITGSKSLEEFVESLESPRKIIVLVKAGDPVDAVLGQLAPLLDSKDVVVDLGNSNYHDTERRSTESKFQFMGSGVSGGEEGALHGPSIMPGGSKEAYKEIEEIFTAISADDGIGGKCVTHIGPGSAGHFVKMVHNGIEYGIMQLLSESYDVLRKLGKYSNKELAKTFEEWNKLDTINGFLTEITAKIFANKENLIDVIQDAAGQKGTGKWTTFAAFDFGVPTPTINAAVTARVISGDSGLRSHKKGLPPIESSSEVPENLKELVQNALEAGIVCAYAQGFQLLEKASEEKSWDLNLSEIARIWRGGCIIRAAQLDLWQKAYDKEDQEAGKKITVPFSGQSQKNWRSLVALATSQGIPVPATYASLAYYDTIMQERLPQNLIQAQRDLFGAHTYERTDKDGTFHTEWS